MYDKDLLYAELRTYAGNRGELYAKEARRKGSQFGGLTALGVIWKVLLAELSYVDMQDKYHKNPWYSFSFLTGSYSRTQ